MLPQSWVLLPPKSLRSRFGDSERFKPLQREGDRFTANGEGGGREREERQGHGDWSGGGGGRTGRWKEGERDRCCLLRPPEWWRYWAVEGGRAHRTLTSAPHQSPGQGQTAATHGWGGMGQDGEGGQIPKTQDTWLCWVRRLPNLSHGAAGAFASFRCVCVWGWGREGASCTACVHACLCMGGWRGEGL